MYNSIKISDKIADIKASAQALVELAEGEKRDFTEDEQASFDGFVNELGADGDEPTGLFAELKKALKFEAQKAAILKPVNRVPEPTTPSVSINPVNRVSGRLKAFKAKEDAYKVGQWYLATIHKNAKSQQFCNDNGIQMAQTEGTTTAGGFLVPDPLAQAVIDVREASGISRQICRVVPMTSDTLNQPKRTGGLTVKYPGEATAIVASDKTWGNVALAVVKRATMTKVSSELNEDSIINVMDDLANEIGRAFALQEDNELINGDGTGTYGSEAGLLNQLGAAGKTTQGAGDTGWSTLLVGDFHTAVGLLPEKYHYAASWLMRRNFYSTIIEPLKFAAGGNTAVDLENGTRPSFLGYPINFSDQMPVDAAAGCASLFGSFQDSVIIGDRSMLTISSSEDFAFDEDVTTVKGTDRYDIAVHEPGDGSDAGGFVGVFNAAS